MLHLLLGSKKEPKGNRKINGNETYSNIDGVDNRSTQNLSESKKLDKANNFGADVFISKNELTLKLY